MATSYLTPNMSLVIPVPGQETGPNWAQEINASLTIVDSHTHSPGSGSLITPSGLNINADLSFNSIANAIAMRSLRFASQISPLALGTDIGCLYEAGVDLYYNDGVGNQIRITQSGSVAGASGTITGLPSGTASAAFDSLSGSFIFQQATSTAANLDVGSVAIRYPGSYPTPTGNYIQLQAPSSISSGYSITLPALPAQTNFMIMNTSGTISASFYVDNSTLEVSGSNLQVKDLGITTGKLAASAVTTAKIADANVTRAKLAALGQQVSSSSGLFSTSSTSLVDVTNLTVTITTTGRPVMLMLVGDGTTTAHSAITMSVLSSATAMGGQVYFLRGSTEIQSINNSNQQASSGSFQLQHPPSAFSYIDVVAAGTYTYKIQAMCLTSNSQWTFNKVKLVAYEIG